MAGTTPDVPEESFEDFLLGELQEEHKDRGATPQTHDDFKADMQSIWKGESTNP